MGILIREADLVEDQAVLIKTLNENRGKSTDEGRYRWRYLNNPQGRAKAWLAIDEADGAVAGFTVAHPRVMCVGGEALTAWNCGDFSINKKYRTLGVAVKLRSAATACVNQGEIPFLYAHPNDRMALIHLKAGHTALGEMVRYARPLGFDRYLPNYLKGSPVSSGLGWAFHKGVSAWTRSARFRRAFQCELHDGFSEEAPYEALMDRVRKQVPVVGLRNRTYLKWRFGDKPLLRVFTLLLFGDGDLLGYAFCSWQDRVIQVHDLFSLPEEGVFNGLVAHLTEVAYSLKAQAISVILLESHPMIHALERNGYLLRPERSKMMVHPSPSAKGREILLDKQHWFITVGDRDV